MERRDIDGYWLVWMDGDEWPQNLYSESMARDRMKTLARANPGRIVHICKLQSVGTMLLPDEMKTSGIAA